MFDDQPQDVVATHQTCPKCGAHDAATFFKDNGVFCHSQCGGFIPDGKKRIKKEMKKPVAGKYMDVRGIPAEVCKMYGIKVGVDEDGNPCQFKFTYPTGFKYRDFHSKKVWWDKGYHQVELFGPLPNAGTSKRIYITEGEFDAPSLFHAMGQTFPVVSVPSASVRREFLKHNHAYLDSFKEIVWAGEQDKAGKECADFFYQAFPEKFFYVPMTLYKDANEFLENGKAEDLKWAALKPQRWTPDNFWCSNEQFAELFAEPTYEYCPTGHSGFDGLAKGVTKGATTILFAQEGIGKSELIGYFEYKVLENDPDAKIAVMHLEEVKSVILGRIASYEVGHSLKYAAGDPVKTKEALEALAKYTEDSRIVVMDMRAEDDPYSVLDHIHLAHSVYGCDYIFLDHLHQVADQESKEGHDERQVLDKLSSRMARMARDRGIAIVAVSHVNDDGKARSSRMIRKQAGIAVDLERDLNNDDEEIKNTTFLKISKNRPWGLTGNAGMLYYNSETNLLEEKLS